MNKDGRPSRINDIRYFCGDVHSYIDGQNDAVAFGRRLAWLLNGEGFSLGAYSSLYIFLTESLAPSVVQVTDYGGDWWQRYVHVGVPTDFLKSTDAPEIIMNATVAALKTIRPDQTAMIEDAEQTVRTYGDDLRFLLKTRQTKRFIVDVSCNIPAWPQPSWLFTSLTDLSNGSYLEAPPLPVGFYGNAFQYNGPIKVTDIENSLSDLPENATDIL